MTIEYRGTHTETKGKFVGEAVRRLQLDKSSCKIISLEFEATPDVPSSRRINQVVATGILVAAKAATASTITSSASSLYL